MKLTKQERKITEYMKEGLTFRQIAKKSDTSITDICRRVNELYAKFNVCDRISLLKKVKG